MAMMRANMGKQLRGNRTKMQPDAESGVELPDFKARAMRPGGMKKGGAVKKYAKGGMTKGCK